MVPKDDRVKAIKEIRWYYDNDKRGGFICSDYLELKCGFSAEYSVQVAEVLAAQDLISFESEYKNDPPVIRLTKLGRFYEEQQAELNAIEEKADKKNRITTAISVIALVLSAINIIVNVL